MNILLIGARASGKSTIGPLLADALHMRFADLDALTLARFAASTIQEVWKKQGEPAWRAAELLCLTEVVRDSNQVIALGGGTPMIPQARALIESESARGKARVVYVRCSPEVLQQRLRRQAGDRPSLTGAPPADEIATVLSSREETYRALAHIECDTSRASPQEAVETLIQWFGTST